MKGQYKIIADPEYGYLRLDPIPTAAELDHFYRDQYYDLVRLGAGAPDLQRLMQGGEEAQAELDWLSQTLWRDIADILHGHTGRRDQAWLLDVGCGPGEFGRYMRDAGWQVVGIEPAEDAARIARSHGICVYGSLEECAADADRHYHAVTLLNVLEHVPDPAGLLKAIRRFLDEESIVVVRVPNDFSAMQECARSKLKIPPWWIAVPDHINYFNFESLFGFLHRVGFQVLDMLGDFPMEVFLLMGEVYVGNPEVGSQCHKKRMALEVSLPAELRRALYRCFARNGVGRDCLAFARPVVSGKR